MPSQKFSNHQLAEVFNLIGNLLEIKGEVIYKILAYRKAADALLNYGRDVNEVWREGKLTDIPGVGKAISEKIDELLTTGELEFLEKLKGEVPESLAQLLPVPDLGPKKIALFWRELGITNLEELEEAAKNGKLRTLPGMGEKSEVRILAGIAALGRRTTRIPLGRAWPFAQELRAALLKAPGVVAVEPAGSLRRMRPTVGDLDIMVAAEDSSPVMAAFVGRPDVARVLGQGETKSSVEFTHGLRAQLWVHPPERFGTALQYATGSKDHNVRLRELALKQGLSLSEHALTRQDGSEILCASEEQVYAALGLPWIPPELREDRGEVQAARAGELPVLIQLSDMQADLHVHTTWSDGKLSVRQMAQAALERGLKILAITDHSQSLGVAGGLTPEDLLSQRVEIDAVQAELGERIRLLQGTEVEIRADGSLDFPDDVLAQLDIVFASLHSGLRQPREKVTERLLNAIRNPHVDAIGHPTGRLIPDREPADLDMEAVLAAAAECGVSLEINAHPSRLDLDGIYARRAIEMGILLSINTDAHADSDLDLLHFGVATARRGWAQAGQVINTWDRERLLSWLEQRGTEAPV
ncbi:MAG TPA: DNA polymerase/3'-5' exonuclease PolX [Anaerolineales bacterium]|nr:DNA polymerase/3'-5' exonuclease PolX [Anaerolineales bacterium]